MALAGVLCSALLAFNEPLQRFNAAASATVEATPSFDKLHTHEKELGAPTPFRATACGSNSLRIQIAAPPHLRTADVLKAQSDLYTRLEAEQLPQLPGAFVEACDDASAEVEVVGDSAEYGNLRVELEPDSAFRFSRVDTGETYMYLRIGFSAPTLLESCAPAAAAPTADTRVRAAMVTIADAAAWCMRRRACAGFAARVHASCGDVDVLNTTRLVHFHTNSAPPPTDAAHNFADAALFTIDEADGTSMHASPETTSRTEPPFTFTASGPGNRDTSPHDHEDADTRGGGGWLEWTKPEVGFLKAQIETAPGSNEERIYGLGQGGWTKPPKGCPSGPQSVVPLARNGQTINLLQTKFNVAIPFAYSTLGYGFVFNMPGYGSVHVGAEGAGGTRWVANAALSLDFWVSGLPKGAKSSAASPIYSQYAEATGHAPMLREEAMLFWQSRNRYKSSAIALKIASNYSNLSLPVGVLVIDYKNMVADGDFAPDPACYSSVKALSAGVRAALNATTVFSFWPEVTQNSKEYTLLNRSNCLINAALGGRVVDATVRACRTLIWDKFLYPRYYQQGVSAYWLDETDGEGTSGGYLPFSGGYETSFGPKAFASNAWVNQWLATFSEPVKAAGREEPLILTRGVWAGGQRHGVVLWSSDIWSSFEELAAMVPQGVHASLSGIPWWTTDVGGYGCGFAQPNDSPYMRQLIVRWYQFGLFCPIFRTHGCRKGSAEPDTAQCKPAQGSCGGNEVWSYGAETQALLERYVTLRASLLLPYIRELALNVSKHGVPTMRPLWYEFPDDASAVHVDDQYLLGPDLLVAPVTVENATTRSVYFPCSAARGGWRSFWNASVLVPCGARITVAAPLETIPVFRRA